MLLAIDVGNTQTVIGMFAPGTARRIRRPGAAAPLAHRHQRRAHRRRDGAAASPSSSICRGSTSTARVTGIAVASVVPRLRAALREMTEKWFPVKTVIVEPGIRTGMPILYDNPKEVGADRIADAVAAFERYGGPTIVIDFGTATTFEAISGARASTSAAPSSPASRSPSTPSSAGPPPCAGSSWSSPAACIGKNTVESIQSGAVYGFAAQVDGLCARFEEELGPCDGRRHRRAGRPHRPAEREHRPPRARG